MIPVSMIPDENTFFFNVSDFNLLTDKCKNNFILNDDSSLIQVLSPQILISNFQRFQEVFQNYC
jgi:hypothetical protein